MKKLLTLFASILILKLSSAQTYPLLKVGANLADVEGLTENSKARLGFYLGGVIKIPVAKTFFIQPELMYSGKGYSFPAVQNNKGGTVNLSYINLPVLFGYNISPKLSVFAGPELGYLVKAKSHSGTTTNDLTNLYRHFDVGADLGIGYNISKKVALDVRYNYGFKDLLNVYFTDPSGNYAGQGKAGANRVLQIGLVTNLR